MPSSLDWATEGCTVPKLRYVLRGELGAALMQTLATFLAGIIPALALLWAVYRYRLGSRRDLALERTKFIFDNLRFFETDPSLQMANQVINDLASGFTIDTFLDRMTEKLGTAEEMTKCMAIDNYLNFLWRIAYAHLELDTIALNDMDAFGYYFYLISKHEKLMEYCVDEGFEEIIDAIEKLKPIWRETERENKSRYKLVASWAAET
jgi:hypothetical protein